jgi:hypothetical protein
MATMNDKLVAEGSQPTYDIEGLAVSDAKVIPTKAYVDNSLGMGGITASAAEINKLAGLATTKTELGKLAGAGARVASGTQAVHAADLKTNYGAGELDTEAKIITALNTTNAKINTILLALEDFGINASV